MRATNQRSSLKRGVLAAIFLLSLGFLTLALWKRTDPADPSFEGKRLTEWLERSFVKGAPDKDTTRAVLHAGTNALPVLLRLVRARENHFQRWISAMEHGPFKSRSRGARRPEARHLMAVWSFEILGETAGPAVPELASTLSDPDPGVRVTAAMCLKQIGHSAVSAVPELQQCLTGAIGSPTKEGAFLAQCIAETLGSFGSAATSAVPVLTVATNSKIPIVRNSAAVALTRIHD